MKKHPTTPYLALISAAAMAACGVKAPSSSTGLEGPIPPGSGQLSVSLMDAPSPVAKEINVTIDKVTAHGAGGWVTVSDKTVSVDLLKLKDSSLALGFANLPPGTVTQIRLHLSPTGVQSVTLRDGSTASLKVPSGMESGIKIDGPFDVAACHRTQVTLDFDGNKSIKLTETGNGEWILRPVIHAKDVSSSDAGCTDAGDATDAGTVSSSGGGSSDAGTPPPSLGGVGTACTTSSSCLSGVCTNNTCDKGGPGAPCAANSDCSSELCQANGTCGSGSAGGAGTTCSAPGNCLSSSCTNQQCDPGSQGAPCVAAGDCATGFTCSTGFCQGSLN